MRKSINRKSNPLILFILLFILCCSSCERDSKINKIIHVTVIYPHESHGNLRSYLIRPIESSSFTLGTHEFYIDSIINDTTINIALKEEMVLHLLETTNYIKIKNLTLKSDNLLLSPSPVSSFKYYSFRIIDDFSYVELLKENKQDVIEVTNFDDLSSIIFKRATSYPNGFPKQVWYEHIVNDRHLRFEKTGEIRIWNKQNQIIKRGSLNKRTIHGKYEEWYDNGLRKVSGSFINGNKDGSWQYYDSNGSILYYGNYINNEGTLYYPNGNVRIIEKNEKQEKRAWYQNRILQAVSNSHGTNYYKDDGTPFWCSSLARDCFYKYNYNTFAQRPWVKYNRDDTLENRYFGEQCVREAICDKNDNLLMIRNYYLDGTTICEINYKNGVQDGKAQTWSPGGVLIYDFYYSKGERDSIWYYYDYYGNMIKKEVYDMGALLSADTFNIQ